MRNLAAAMALIATVLTTGAANANVVLDFAGLDALNLEHPQTYYAGGFGSLVRQLTYVSSRSRLCSLSHERITCTLACGFMCGLRVVLPQPSPSVPSLSHRPPQKAERTNISA
jgi:hypothetical protein